MMARPAPLNKPRAGAAGDAGHAEWRDEIVRLDGALYSAIATTATPELDRYFRQLSRAADHSKLWIASAGILAAAGGQSGRRAAVNSLASIAAASAGVNLVLKPLSRRRRPDRRRHRVPTGRRVRMPTSTSFPSGHAASAFAFATGVATAAPRAALPLSAAAALVSYSRVHTGVHYPSDVIVGAVLCAGLAPLVVAALDRGRLANATSR
jgi:membrane-associated phospholipid phosphatase